MAAMAYDIAARELDVTHRSLNFTLDELNAKAPASLFEHVKRVVQTHSLPAGRAAPAAARGVNMENTCGVVQPRYGACALSTALGKPPDASNYASCVPKRNSSFLRGSQARRLPTGTVAPRPVTEHAWAAPHAGSRADSQLTLVPRRRRTKRPRSDNLNGHGGSSASEAGLAPATSRRRLWPSYFDGTQFQVSGVRAAPRGVAFVAPCGAQGVSAWFQAAYRPSESMHHLATHGGVGTVVGSYPVLNTLHTALVPHLCVAASGVQHAGAGVQRYPAHGVTPGFHGDTGGILTRWMQFLRSTTGVHGAGVSHQTNARESRADARAWMLSKQRARPPLAPSTSGVHGMAASG